MVAPKFLLFDPSRTSGRARSRRITVPRCRREPLNCIRFDRGGPESGRKRNTSCAWRPRSSDVRLATLERLTRQHILRITSVKGMTTRQGFLEHLWKEVINLYLRDGELDAMVSNGKRYPDRPFGDTGATIERMLAAGVSKRDLSLVLRYAAYNAVFGTLYSFSDPGVDDDTDVGGLYEELLMADPSGMEGRPGSANAVRR